MNDIIKINGTLRLVVKDKDGKVKYDSGLIENLVVNAGKAAIAGLTGNIGSITAFSYLALGTSGTAEAVTDTALGTEITDSGLARAAATVSRVTTSVTNDTVQFAHTWTASASKSNIQEIGIFNAASSGTMLTHKTFTPFSMVNLDTATITYGVQFT